VTAADVDAYMHEKWDRVLTYLVEPRSSAKVGLFSFFYFSRLVFIFWSRIFVSIPTHRIKVAVCFRDTRGLSLDFGPGVWGWSDSLYCH